MKRLMLITLAIFVFTQYVSASIIQENEMVWNITKTGAEVYVDVSYKNINRTTTEFTFTPQFNYANALAQKGSNIRYVPIISLDTSTRLSKSILDLSSGSNKVQVTYATRNVSFKFGTSSITINADNSLLATAYPTNRKLCRTPNRLLHTAYIDSGSDLQYGVSSDNGTTWSNTEIATGTYDTPGIFCKSNNNVTAVAINSVSDVYGLDYNGTWSGIYVIEDDVDSFVYYSCDVDTNDRVHCILTSDLSSPTYYVNSSAWDTTYVVNGNTSDASPTCNIRFKNSSCYYIGCQGGTTDDYNLWSNCYNGFGYWNHTRVYDGSVFTTQSQGYSLDLGFYNDDYYFVTINNKDLIFCNSTNLVSFTCSTIDTAESDFASMQINYNGIIEIIYNDGTALSSNVRRANSTSTNQPLFSLSTLDVMGVVSMLGTEYPSSNVVTNLIEYVGTTTAVVYSNYSIYYSDAPIITTFTVTLPSGKTYAYFSAQNSTSTLIEPDGQASNVPFFNITNTGNIAQTFKMMLNETRNGITLQADSDSVFSGSKTITTSLTSILTLSSGNNGGVWLWTNVTSSAIPQNSTSKFNITTI